MHPLCRAPAHPWTCAARLGVIAWKVNPKALALCVFAVTALGCNERTTESPPLEPPELKIGAKSISCDVGEKPEYFVPGGEDGLLVGCARLETSGKTVTFSVHATQIGDQPFSCINPAYEGRGNPGMYIPATCVRKVGGEIRAIGSRVPEQGVRNYGRVIWGIAPRAETRVEIGTGGEVGEAAVFAVSGNLRTAADAGRTFNVFVAEVPESLDCDAVQLAPGTPRQRSACAH